MSVATAERQYLTTGQVAAELGWTIQKVRTLCEQGRIPAVNTSTTANRPRWTIRRCDLDSFLTPASVAKATAKQAAAVRRQRIDAGVPNVFG